MIDDIEARVERAERFMELQLDASKVIASQLQAIVTAINAIVRVSPGTDVHAALQAATDVAHKMHAPKDVIDTLNAIAKR